MIRRQLLKSTVTAVPVLLTGCLGTTSGGSSGNEGGTGELDSSVNADEPTLSPGEKTSLQIDATDVLLLQVLLPYQNDEDGIEFGDTSVSPQPDRQLDVFPPKWVWKNPTDVTVEVPISVRPNAAATTISYDLYLVQSNGRTSETTEPEYTITITNS